MSHESLLDGDYDDRHGLSQEQMELSSGEEEALLSQSQPSQGQRQGSTHRRGSSLGGSRIDEVEQSSPVKREIPKPVQIEEPKKRDRFPLDEEVKAKYDMWMGGHPLTHTEREALIMTLPLIDSCLALAPRVEESLARESSATARLALSEGALFALQDTLYNAVNQMTFALNCIKNGRDEDAVGYLDVSGKLSASVIHDLTVMRRERVLNGLNADTRHFTNYRWAPLAGNEMVRSQSGRGEPRPALFGTELMASFKESAKDRDFIEAVKSSSKSAPRSQSQQSSSGFRSENKASTSRRRDEPSTSRGFSSARTPSSAGRASSNARTPMKRRFDEKKPANTSATRGKKSAK